MSFGNSGWFRHAGWFDNFHDEPRAAGFGLNPDAPLTTHNLDLGLARLHQGLDGFRVVQLSDLHFGPYTGEREIAAAIDAANAAAPDLVVLTGDFVTSTWLFHLGRRNGREIYPCAELLRRLRCPGGVYAILGNHDWGVGAEFIAGVLTEAGIRVLRNESVPLERDGARLWLAGVDDAMYQAADLGRALAQVPAAEPVLLLAHEPDLADEAARYPVDIQLSGHSHGGQIVMPLVGPGYLPPLGRKYPRGLYEVDRLKLYVNRGIGVAGLPLRLNAPPEVTVLALHAGELSHSRKVARVPERAPHLAGSESPVVETT